ncbi:MAG: DUF2326 domain-containing protein [Coriobacteriia bacterium]
MRLITLTGSDPRFQRVDFQSGFNVVLADKEPGSSDQDSRNGVGKSKLIEIVDYCLGSSPKKDEGLRVGPLEEMRFTLELDLAGERVTVSRGVAAHGSVSFGEAHPSWAYAPEKTDLFSDDWSLPVAHWRLVLGMYCFGLPSERFDYKFAPGYRGLISYFLRYPRSAYLDPFSTVPRQAATQWKTLTAFLLALEWRHPLELALITDDLGHAEALAKATKLVGGGVSGVGSLEAKRVKLEVEVAEQNKALSGFQVNPRYAETQELADSLTRQMHQLADRNFADRQLLNGYRSSLAEQTPPSDGNVDHLYAEAGVSLPDSVIRSLDEVRHFHDAVVQNRAEYLAGEMRTLETAIADRDQRLKELTEERGQYLSVLASTTALDQYAALQGLHQKSIAELEALETQIRDLRDAQTLATKLKIQREELIATARADLDARAQLRDEAIRLFGEISGALYPKPGSLVIDVTDRGFKFGTEIERAGSEGVDSMTVFTFDLTLAILWSAREYGPGILVHDSTLFDGVDERQVASALRLAKNACEVHGIQYICSLNTDRIPDEQWLPTSELDVYEFAPLVLHDKDASGTLFGFRF